jgi:hypothetical protein
MRARLPTRLKFVICGTAAAVILTWVIPVWALQPSLPPRAGLMSEADAARWPGLRRAEAGLCFALNAVWCSAGVWLLAGGAELVRARAPAPPTPWRRT